MALDPIQARLTRGDIVLLDGAMGTELERLGVPTALPLWSAQALLDAPDRVRQVHESYVQAGADVITSATFRTTPRSLKKAGLEAEADRLTTLAVELAKQVGRAGATYPAVFNASNEQAVLAFHAGRIGYLDIVDTVQRVVEAHESQGELTLESLAEAERWARARADTIIDTIAR